MKIATCFHVGEFVREEMEYRGWSSRDLAGFMGYADLDVGECAVDLLVAVTDNPNVLLADSDFDGLARAFGTSAELWKNIDASWRSWHAARKAMKGTP